MTTETRSRTLTDFTRNLITVVALGALLLGVLTLGTPFAAWSCAQSARTACGDGAKATATYTGNAISGRCDIRCN